MRARLNGQTVFLSDEKPPGFSTSLNDLLDITKVKGLSSTTVEIVATPEALRALGGDGMQEVARTRGNILRMGNDDRDHFTSEFIPVRWSRNKIEGYCAGGNARWFDHAKGTRLREVDYGAITINSINQSTSWGVRALVYWPLVDHGAFEGNGLPGPYDVQVEQLRPSLSIYVMLYEAWRQAGYNFDVSPKVLAQLEPAYILSGASLNATTSVDVVIEGDYQDWDGVTFYTIEANGTEPDAASNLSSAQNVNWQGGQYEAPNTGLAKLGAFSYWFQVQGTVPGEEFRLVLWHVENSEAVYELPYICTGSELSLNGGDYIHFEGVFPEVFMVQGQHLRVGVTGDTIHTDGIAVRPSPGYSTDVFARIRTYGGPYEEGNDLEIASAAPSMTIAQLMSVVANWLGLVYVTDPVENRISVQFERDYFRKGAPGVSFRDWTDRMDYTEAPVKVSDGVPVRYRYRWAPDEGDRSLAIAEQAAEEPGYGNADVDVPRGYEDEQVIEMPFSATAMDKMFGEDGGFQIPVIRREDSIGEDDFGHTPRLLMHGFQRTGSWRFDGVDLTSYPWSYFVSDREQDLPVHFGLPLYYGGQQSSVLDLYGQQRLRRMRDSLFLECRMRIHDHEMIDFDHGLPTLVNYKGIPTWFWVYEIRNHVFGQHGTTEVVLVEIPGAEVSYERPEQTQVTFPEVIPAPEVTIVQTNNCIEGEFTLTATFSDPSSISNFEIIVNGGSLTYLNNPTSPTNLGTYNTVDDTVEIQMTYGPGPGGQYPVVSLGEWDGTGGSACAGGPCGGPYMRVRSATGVMSIGNTRTSTGYITLKNELGQVTLGNGVPGTFITGAMTSVGEECNVCIYSSDVNGNASGSITYLTIAGQDLIEVQDMGDDTDALLTLNLGGNDLDANSVDLVLNGLDASLAAGLVDLSGGTSAAPTGASSAAVTALGGNGWTVNTN